MRHICLVVRSHTHTYTCTQTTMHCRERRQASRLRCTFRVIVVVAAAGDGAGDGAGVAVYHLSALSLCALCSCFSACHHVQREWNVGEFFDAFLLLLLL